MVGPFTTNSTLQFVCKTSAPKGCGKIMRSLCRTPRYRRIRASCDHHDFACNAAHGELDQRFLEEFLIVVNSNLFPITLNNPTLIKH